MRFVRNKCESRTKRCPVGHSTGQIATPAQCGHVEKLRVRIRLPATLHTEAENHLLGLGAQPLVCEAIRK